MCYIYASSCYLQNEDTKLLHIGTCFLWMCVLHWITWLYMFLHFCILYAGNCLRLWKCWYRYIAKTIYGGDDDDDDGEDSRKTEITSEPKVLGLHPTSNEKVHSPFPLSPFRTLDLTVCFHLRFWTSLVLSWIYDMWSLSFRFFWRMVLMGYMFSLVKIERDTRPRELLLLWYIFSLSHLLCVLMTLIYL